MQNHNRELGVSFSELGTLSQAPTLAGYLQVQSLQASITDLRQGQEEREEQALAGDDDCRDDDSAEGDEGELCNVCAPHKLLVHSCCTQEVNTTPWFSVVTWISNQFT